MLTMLLVFLGVYVGTCVVVAGGYFAVTLVRGRLERRRQRKLDRVFAKTDAAKQEVARIAHQAQVEMLRIVMAGRSHRTPPAQ